MSQTAALVTDQYPANKKLSSIISCVIFFHVVLFGFLVPHTRDKPHRIPATKLAVRTIALTPAPQERVIAEEIVAIQQEPAPPLEPNPEPIVEAAAIETPSEIPLEAPSRPEPKKAAPPQPKPSPKPVSKPKPKPAPKPKAQPAPEKAPAKKTTTPKKEAPKQQTSNQEAMRRKKEAEAAKKAENEAARKAQEKQNALVADALASLNQADKLNAKKAKVSAGAGSSRGGTTANTIDSLASDSLVSIQSTDEVLTGREKTYYDELVHRLKLHLKLPDYGDVKIKLTLLRNGKVKSVECTKSKSKKNADHLKKVLPAMVFPAFGQNFPGESEHTFHLHFANDLTY